MQTTHNGRPNMIVIFTTILIAVSIDFKGECPFLNSGPNCKNDFKLIKKSLTTKGKEYIRNTPAKRIVKTYISLD